MGYFSLMAFNQKRPQQKMMVWSMWLICNFWCLPIANFPTYLCVFFIPRSSSTRKSRGYYIRFCSLAMPSALGLTAHQCALLHFCSVPLVLLLGEIAVGVCLASGLLLRIHRAYMIVSQVPCYRLHRPSVFPPVFGEPPGFELRLQIKNENTAVWSTPPNTNMDICFPEGTL